MKRPSIKRPTHPLRYLAILPALGFPALMVHYYFTLDFTLNPYNFLWLAFYSTLLAFWALPKKFSIPLAILNLPWLLFFLFISLMGGFAGLFRTLLSVFLPIPPLLDAAQHFFNGIFPYEP